MEEDNDDELFFRERVRMICIQGMRIWREGTGYIDIVG